MIATLLTLLVPALVAIYTYNYGRWAWKQEFRAGAAGLFILAGLTFGVPLFLLWWLR